MHRFLRRNTAFAAGPAVCLLLYWTLAPPRSPAAQPQLPAAPHSARDGQLSIQDQIQNPLPEENKQTAKQRKDLLKYRFESMKKDADRLTELADSLQKEIDHSNQNILSLAVVAKADKIEKLAKKIKENAKGY